MPKTTVLAAILFALGLLAGWIDDTVPLAAPVTPTHPTSLSIGASLSLYPSRARLFNRSSVVRAKGQLFYVYFHQVNTVLALRLVCEVNFVQFARACTYAWIQLLNARATGWSTSKLES